ncbi:hypothetical protein ABGB18_46725 [Nonomuraea sp. B12E4]|uniref:hypothetical protein n=1 Tax=Nonomuraea sp. B12E4 TaxID=3153564 RepID=UPI00325C50DB
MQISPGNTDPVLTRGANFATAPKRQYPNYFRVVGTDDLQGRGPCKRDVRATSPRGHGAGVSLLDRQRHS